MANGLANVGCDTDRETLECDTCKLDGFFVTAAGFCKSCFEYICTDCIRQHCRPRQMRNHVVVGKDKMPKRRVSNEIIDRACDCGKNDIEIYCQVHRTLLCGQCFRQNHRSCNYRELSEEPDGYEKSRDYIDFHEDLNISEREFTKTRSLASDFKTRYIQSFDNVFEEIKNLQKLLRQKLEHVDKLETEAKKMQEEYRRKMQLIENKNGSAIFNIREIRDDLKTIEKIDQAGKLFVALHRSLKAVLVLKGKMKNINEGVVSRKLQYIPCAILQNALTNMNDTGKVNEFICPDGIQSIEKKPVTEYVEYGLPKCIALSPSCVAVIDRIYNTLQVFKAGEMFACIRLSSGPWDLARLSNKSLVVTMPIQEKVVFVKLENKAIHIEKDVCLKCKCEGIASAENKLFMASSAPACIVIYDTRASQEIRRIFKENVFEQPAYIDVHLRKGLICLSDRKSNKIFIMNEQGAEIREFASENMKMPLSVAFRDNTVVAIGYESNTINKIFYEQRTENTVETKYLDDIAVDKVFRDPAFVKDPSWKLCASKYFMLVCKSSQ